MYKNMKSWKLEIFCCHANGFIFKWLSVVCVIIMVLVVPHLHVWQYIHRMSLVSIFNNTSSGVSVISSFMISWLLSFDFFHSQQLPIEILFQPQQHAKVILVILGHWHLPDLSSSMAKLMAESMTKSMAKSIQLARKKFSWMNILYAANNMPFAGKKHG